MGLLAVLLIAAMSAGVAVSANTPTVTAAATGECSPELDAVWGVEAEPLQVPIVCGTGKVPAAADVALVDPPPGATLDASGTTIEWTPGLDQAATYDVGVRVGSEQAMVVVGVGDAWSHPDNVPPLEPARLTRESGLPVFHLVTDSSIGTEEYRDARITYGGHEYSGTEAKLRGSLSLGYEKDNFTLRFDAADPFTDPELGGLDGSLKLVLNGNFDDNSHLRNRLAFELWNEMHPDHLRVDHASAVVYVDGEYAGLYTVTDQVGAEFLEAAGLDGGELYKAVGHRADFTSSAGSLRDRELEQKVPDPDDITVDEPAVFDLYEFVDRADASTFRSELAERVVLDDFVGWFVLATIVGAGDSTAKNVYLYAPAGEDGFRAVPWDFNHSFGQDFLTARVAPDELLPSSLGAGNRLFERLLDEPQFRSLLVDRTTEVLGGVGSAEAVDALVRRLGGEVGDAARRDQQRWDAVVRATPAWAGRDDFTTFDTELDHIVDWYAERVGRLAADLDRLAS
jgi:hypothetical protein